jgi:hypothetical protein
LNGQPTRTSQEQAELDLLEETFSGGFCLGGNLLPDRTPHAFEMLYRPSQTAPTPARELAIGETRFWGCPNLIERLVQGVDLGFLAAVLQSGQWTGTPAELVALAQPFRLAQPVDLPIREALLNDNRNVRS